MFLTPIIASSIINSDPLLRCSINYYSRSHNGTNEKGKVLTNAFCFGDTRQQITDAQPTASPKNWSLTSSSKAYVRVFPSIINANAACGSLSSFIICEALVI